MASADSVLGLPTLAVVCSTCRCRLREVHHVGVDEAEGAHARGREVEAGGRAEAARARSRSTFAARSLACPASPTSGTSRWRL